MNFLFRMMVVSAVLLILPGCGGAPDPAQPADTTPVETPAGELVFRVNCAVCHEVRPGGFRSLADLTAGSKHFTSRDMFIAFLRHPEPPGMPPFRPEELSDEEIMSLYDWLKLETGN